MRRDASIHVSSENPAEQGLQTIEKTVTDLLSQVQGAREAQKSQAQRIAQLEHENHALHLALQKIKEQRAKDRQVIEMWRQYNSQEPANAEPLTTDALTQEGPNPATIPSSPPPESSRSQNQALPSSSQEMKHHNSYELSQRVLPMSIDVDELYEGQIKHEHNGSGGISDDERISSSQPDLDVNDGRQMAKRSASEHSALVNSTKRTRGGQQHDSASQSSQQTTLSDLVHRVWHPSDFILNPTPAAGGQRANHAFVEVVRNKNLRQCMHGTNCKSCATFYDLVGPEAVAKSSRHRSDYSHQETPAGFWRTEFPESSDAQEDQLEAQAQWAAEGRTRLFEALNGGKYLFKDKELREKVRIQLHESERA